MDTGMTAESRQAVGEALHTLLADLYAVFVMTENLHWNLTGKEFFALHIMFEKQYQALHEAIDEVAERIRALGLYVDASLGAFQKRTSIKEIKQVMNAPDGLQHLLQALEMTIKKARTVGTLADEKSDHATVDLIGKMLDGMLEKSAWMVRSSL